MGSSLIKYLTLIVLIVVIGGLGRLFFDEYDALHPYYDQFIAGEGGLRNLQILLLGVACALIPVSYLMRAKKKSFRSLMLFIWLGLWLFQSSYVYIKAELIGGAVFKTLINTGFILGLATLFCTQLVAFGHRIQSKWTRLSDDNPVIQFLLNFGLGLIGFLSIEYLFLLLNIAFPIVNRLLFAGGCRLIRSQREALSELWTSLQDRLRPEKSFFRHTIGGALFGLLLLPLAIVLFQLTGGFRAWGILLVAGGLICYRLYDATTTGDRGREIFGTRSGWLQIALFLLLVISFRYLYNGFTLAHIPYPTARDANHAYMFYPKMFALHNGYYRNELSMRGFNGIWLPYITYRFSLFTPTQGFLSISPDTIAIQMNFLSGIYVLLFGIGLVRVLVSDLGAFYRRHQDDTQQIQGTTGLVMLGWFLVLQWLTSGMGAFLVFIDNKTDMGVLAMVILAILSGFIFLRQYMRSEHHEISNASIRGRLVLSGVFFAFAALAKPTAMFDILNFGLLLRGQWFGILGVLGIPVLVMGLLAVIKMRGVGDYFSPAVGKRWTIVGGLIAGSNLARVIGRGMHHLKKYGSYLLIWTASVLVVLVGAKLLYYIPDAIFFGLDRSPKEIIQTLLIGKHTPQKPTVLLAQTSGELPTPTVEAPRMDVVTQSTCSLSSEGLSTTDQLYDALAISAGNGYNEDVGRYIGYGWKGSSTDQRKGISAFADHRWFSRLETGCTGFSPFFLDTHDAKVLCETEAERKSFDSARLDTVLAQLKPDGKAYPLVKKIKDSIGTASANELATTFGQTIVEIDAIMQGDTIKVVEDSGGMRTIYFPYKYLNFFNITFNRSLQNLSSYYTDIGIVRLLLIFITVIGLIYGLFRRERFLTTIHLITLFGRILWLVIGGGILRYAIGIIVWTILSFIVFMYSLSRNSDRGSAPLLGIFLVIFCLYASQQLYLNMLRISTQGGGGAFMRYKTNNGLIQDITITPQGQITPTQQRTGSFGSDDVFALQFPHYNTFLDHVNQREKGEGAIIAGTYARYFVKNQSHIVYDQFLEQMRKRSSDNNICRTYLRLKDQGIRYLAIDPNIGTVVQGDGNKSLFARFFGLLNPTDGLVEQHGTFTMLAALFQGGYLRYVSANSLGAKYAFLIPDSAFGGMTPDQITVMRAKMAIARFFPQEGQLVSSLLSIADQRVKDGSFVTDMADVMGAQVSDTFVANIMQGTQIDPNVLTLDEKKVLNQFFQIRQMANTAPDQYNQTLQQIVTNSLGAGNQIVVLEVVK